MNNVPSDPAMNLQNEKQGQNIFTYQQANDCRVITGREINEYIINWLHCLSLAQCQAFSV